MKIEHRLLGKSNIRILVASRFKLLKNTESYPLERRFQRWKETDVEKEKKNRKNNIHVRGGIRFIIH